MENYRLVSRLTVFNISKEDIGIYKCVSKNSLGETESTVRLYGMYDFKLLLYFILFKYIYN